ncbi:4Fe-4S dicluster domain-containing protein [Breoghania sp. L-A4]|nr:4Fe-4S dicluster domain-containing protein [Breoghania sp. L-A4]
MDLDPHRLREALGKSDIIEGGDPVMHRHLCRTQIEAFERALETGEPLLVACTQEAPLFSEIAEETGPQEDGAEERVRFVNIRERAGWTDKGQDPHAKIAALLHEAVLDSEPAGLKSIASDGMCLVYGAGQQALDAARALNGKLSVTLLLSAPGDMMLPSVMDVPIYHGRVRNTSGSLGHFEVTVDGYAPILPSSRGEPQFLMGKDGARSQCSLILDLSGEAPLVTGWEKRDGYLRADPGDPAAVARAIFEISDMVGTFEKPLYVSYNADICAHSRSGRTGCSICLDVCPAGAITDDGDTVAYDHAICAGCGSCAASCPTGAVSYAFPRRAGLITRMQALLGHYLDAGGTNPVLLLHDGDHGGGIIAAMARHGRGLPDNVLPMSLHAVTATGHESILAGFLAGAQHVVWLADPRKADELPALQRELTLAQALGQGLGFDMVGRFSILEESDPDRVEAALYALAPRPALEAKRFAPVGGKRDVARAALSHLHAIAPAPSEVVALPEDAPYGRIAIASEGCTLCLSCVSACPANALADNPDRPQVRFTEAACVQCGLCADTCPEGVITLEPRYSFRADASQPAVLHEEEPATCLSCGKPFGTQSTINRITERLAGNHYMFQSSDQIKLIQMCDDCRVAAQWTMPNNPFGGGERPRPRTTSDYTNARDKGLSVDDFLKGE